jgi:predicted small metal-binding protein
MKLMTCRELGGSCDYVLTAEMCEGVAELMWIHMKEKHPLVLTEIENSGPDEWRRAVRNEWDATSEAHPQPTLPRPLLVS